MILSAKVTFFIPLKFQDYSCKVIFSLSLVVRIFMNSPFIPGLFIYIYVWPRHHASYKNFAILKISRINHKLTFKTVSNKSYFTIQHS